jgi:hypothetical protein
MYHLFLLCEFTIEEGLGGRSGLGWFDGRGIGGDGEILWLGGLGDRMSDEGW